jgi:histidinol-phosphatase (PHP family)
MIRANFHTHTTFSDGAHSPAEMVEAALSLNMTAIGFSDHSPLLGCKGTSGILQAHESAYRQEILRLKEAYAGQIEVYLGIEMDSNSLPTSYCYDYSIGSIHGIWVDSQYRAVDYKEDWMLDTVDNYFGGDHYAYAKSYFRAVGETANKHDPTFFGHIDLVAKYNEGGKYFDESDKRYRNAALEALEALLPTGKPFEINTGAISRGVRTTPYPAPFILKEICEHGGKIILNGDSHNAESLLCAYGQATELARFCGFATAIVLAPEGLREVKL